MTRTDEILTIAQEECSEVIQVISKGRRFGFDVSYGGATNRQRLTTEVGDVLTLIDIMIEDGIIDESEVLQAKRAKREKLAVWSNICQPKP